MSAKRDLNKISELLSMYKSHAYIANKHLIDVIYILKEYGIDIERDLSEEYGYAINASDDFNINYMLDKIKELMLK